MARLDGTPRRRIHVTEGIVVASTNFKQFVCCRDLVIIHKYRINSYKRIARYVQHSNTTNYDNNKNVKEK